MDCTINETDIQRVEFPDGNWWDVKKELTQEDNDYILAEMIRKTSARLSLLERSTVKWSFDLPINRDNINKIKPKYRTPVLKEIDRLATEANQFAKN